MANKKMLVVDDEADFCELMKMRLQASGYDVLIANDGMQALDMIKKEKVDAVLLDIMMPGLDGLDVLKEIRASYPKMPVFMVTAFSNEERIKLARKLKASGFIVKTKQDMSKEIDNITKAMGGGR